MKNVWKYLFATVFSLSAVAAYANSEQGCNRDECKITDIATPEPAQSSLDGCGCGGKGKGK